MTAYRRRQATALSKRQTELATMQDRLLNAYLAGTVEEVVYKAKSNELKAESARTDESLAQLGDVDPARGKTAVALFDWSQRAADVWRGSNNAIRREILDAVYLNRRLDHLKLAATKRKPFDVLAKGLDLKNSRPSCQFFEPVIADFTDAALQPPSYLRRLHELARECA